ncbi:uncharacterized protein LOC106136046 [Amyelois transitella]|uniref:uncharacterized protein LOC106136046 n=1 Tax=Amyelois transitella TaxID=680683 RepID=UPI00299053F1|nr:uncharacterized protein LOC106136046 [Amyelois transitella]
MKGILVTLAVAVAAVACANQCPTDQASNWELELLLPHEDCDKFYKCTYGVPVPQNCPAGLYYNIDYEQCDWKDRVDCGDRIEPEEGDNEETTVIVPVPESESESDEVVPEPDAESESDEAVPESEAESESDEAVPEPDVESESDEVAPEPDVESESDEAAPEPDVESESDEAVPEPESESESEEVIVPESEESTQEPEFEFLENGCPVNPLIHWLLPSEEDCNQFYYCVFGEKVLRQCPRSLHFNPQLQVCDFPADAGCQLAFNKRIPVRPMLISV